jgi:hypothetical protein
MYDGFLAVRHPDALTHCGIEGRSGGYQYVHVLMRWRQPPGDQRYSQTALYGTERHTMGLNGDRFDSGVIGRMIRDR